jgi:hypothetical protein
MMAKKENFPKTLFVKFEGPTHERYLCADAVAEMLLEQGEEVTIASYELVTVQKGRLKAEWE